MNIGPNTVATFHYTLRDTSGEELESSRGGEPTAYLHGASNIIPGLETQLLGRGVGGRGVPGVYYVVWAQVSTREEIKELEYKRSKYFAASVS